MPCLFHFLSLSLLIFLLEFFNALKALDYRFVSLSQNLFHWASLLRTAGKQYKMLLRRLPGPRKRVGENVHTYAHARTKTIPRPNSIADLLLLLLLLLLVVVLVLVLVLLLLIIINYY